MIQKKQYGKRAQMLLILIICGVVPSMWTQNRYFMHLLTFFMINVVLYLGLNLLLGLSGQVSLGHAAFYGIGAYTGGLMCTKLNMPFGAAVVCGILLSVLIGALLGLPTARLQGVYLAMTTYGFTQLFYLLLVNLRHITNGPIGILNIGPMELFGIKFDTAYKKFLLIYLFALLAMAAFTRIKHSPIGRAWRAMKDSRIAAQAMGIDIPRYNVLAFAICSAFAGLAGVLYAYYNTYVSPDQFTTSLTPAIVAVLVIGGRGTILGTLIAAFIQTFIPEWLRPLGDFRFIIFPTLLILFVLFFPDGCVGLIQKGKEYILKRMGKRKAGENY